MTATIDDLTQVSTVALYDQLDAITSELLTRSYAREDDEALLQHWQQLERHRNRLGAVEAALVAPIDARGVAQARNVRSTATLAVTLLRITGHEAGVRVAAAKNFGPRATLTGERIDPVFPQAAAALGAGVISPRHAAVIAQCISKLPVTVRDEVWDTVETHLVAAAGQVDPFRLEQHARDLASALDPDGTLADERHRERHRGLQLCRRADGSGSGSFELTAEAMEYVSTALDAFMRPNPEVDGVKDPRSASQRRHDALLAVAKAALRGGELPTTAGVTTTVILTTTAADWREGEGVVRTGHGIRIPMRTAKRWAGAEYRLMGVSFDEQGGIDGWTDARRLFTEAQRLAMNARDKGCTQPGCDAPPGQCEIHHIIEHTDAGPTLTDNGALACSWNHAHHEELGWQCVMLGGVVHWIAPTWLDPTQTPQRNTMHDI